MSLDWWEYYEIVGNMKKVRDEIKKMKKEIEKLKEDMETLKNSKKRDS